MKLSFHARLHDKNVVLLKCVGKVVIQKETILELCLQGHSRSCKCLPVQSHLTRIYTILSAHSLFTKLFQNATRRTNTTKNQPPKSVNERTNNRNTDNTNKHNSILCNSQTIRISARKEHRVFSAINNTHKRTEPLHRAFSAIKPNNTHKRTKGTQSILCNKASNTHKRTEPLHRVFSAINPDNTHKRTKGTITQRIL